MSQQIRYQDSLHLELLRKVIILKDSRGQFLADLTCSSYGAEIINVSANQVQGNHFEIQIPQKISKTS